MPLTESDILRPSEAFCDPLDYVSYTEPVRTMIEKLAAIQPRVLACLHGSARRGVDGRLQRALGEAPAA